VSSSLSEFCETIAVLGTTNTLECFFGRVCLLWRRPDSAADAEEVLLGGNASGLRSPAPLILTRTALPFTNEPDKGLALLGVLGVRGKCELGGDSEMGVMLLRETPEDVLRGMKTVFSSLLTLRRGSIADSLWVVIPEVLLPGLYPWITGAPALLSCLL